MSRDNASASNLELSRHVDRIIVTSDGKIQIRMCKLGFMVDPGAMRIDPDTSTSASVTGPQKPKRPRRLIESDETKPWESVLRADYSIDPHRFDHLPDIWFWIDTFAIPYKKPWSEEHALEVAQSRQDAPCGLEALAKRFGVSKPTIEVALRNAKALGIDATNVDGRKLHRNWAEDNAMIVAEYFRRPGAKMSEAVAHFGKSDAWIRRARKLGNQSGSDDDRMKP